MPRTGGIDNSDGCDRVLPSHQRREPASFPLSAEEKEEKKLLNDKKRAALKMAPAHRHEELSQVAERNTEQSKQELPDKVRLAEPSTPPPSFVAGSVGVQMQSIVSTKSMKEGQPVLKLAPGRGPDEDLPEKMKQKRNETELAKEIRLADPTPAPPPDFHHRRPHDSVNDGPTFSDEARQTNSTVGYPTAGSLAFTSTGRQPIYRDGEEKQEDAEDANTLAGNTLVVEAERVPGTDRYEELERELEQKRANNLELQQELEALRNQQRQAVLADVIPSTGNDSSNDSVGRGVASGAAASNGASFGGQTNDEKDFRGQGTQSNRVTMYIIFAGVGIISFLVVLLVIFLIGGSSSSSSSSNPSGIESLAPTLMPSTNSPTVPRTTSPTTAPTNFPTEATPSAAPTSPLHIIADILGIENINLLSETSSEIQALEWMTYDDPLSDELVRLATIDGGSNRILSERYALAVLYFSTNGISSWLYQHNFLSGDSVCEWNNGVYDGTLAEKGVYCNLLGQVVRMHFEVNGLAGTIPSQLVELIALTRLRLGENDLIGTIPESLSMLTMLETLGFNTNRLTGTIPETFGSLTRLISLSVSQNQLTGTVPPQLGMLTGMLFLSMGINELTGTIPAELAASSLMISLSFTSNQLSGTIPDGFGSTMTRLSLLSFATNRLTGTVPESLGSLPALRHLFLEGNDLSGDLDPIFCPLPPFVASLQADCLGPARDVICSCCTRCY